MKHHNNHKNVKVRKRRIQFSPEDTPGVICIERRMQNETTVVTGTLKIGYNEEPLEACISRALKEAAVEIRAAGGVVGQIKAAITVTSEEILALVDGDAIENETSRSFARVSIAATMVFAGVQNEAENIIRIALAKVRSKVREQKN